MLLHFSRSHPDVDWFIIGVLLSKINIYAFTALVVYNIQHCNDVANTRFFLLATKAKIAIMVPGLLINLILEKCFYLHKTDDGGSKSYPTSPGEIGANLELNVS